ncbi:MAG: aldo/keto reductase [Planctomycetes bacterium]|nr:aldo/keto reductase [Planctomycetota bacterium]
MKKIRFGSTALQVSPVCYGSWQASPKFWGRVDEDDLQSCMRRAFELGVNFFDTADAYGDGLSETILGRALADFPRHELVIATKVYNHFYPDGHRHPDLSHDYVLEECEASLRRLGTDYVDLYQLHFFDPLTHLEETTAALEKLVEAGKVRHYGLSNFSTEQVRWARSLGSYETLQPRYSLLHTDDEKDVLPYCRTQDMGVLAYSPLYHGMLTGKYTGTEKFQDFRSGLPDFRGKRFKQIASAVASLGPIAGELGVSIVQLVLAVTLATPLIDCVIVGIKKPEHIEEAARVPDIAVPREVYHKVRGIIAAVK